MLWNNNLDLMAMLSAKQKLSLEIARENGASSWLNALPIAQHSVALHKNAVCLHYGWKPSLLPSVAPPILWSMPS